jgi:hypothetical protein
MRADKFDCAIDDLDAVVTVEVRVAVGGWGRARAAARAGPASAALVRAVRLAVPRGIAG